MLRRDRKIQRYPLSTRSLIPLLNAKAYTTRTALFIRHPTVLHLPNQNAKQAGQRICKHRGLQFIIEYIKIILSESGFLKGL